MKRSFMLLPILALLLPYNAQSVTKVRSGDDVRRGLQIDLRDAPGTVYQQGDAVEFEVRSTSNSYPIVFNIDTEGYVELLHPADETSLSSVPAGGSITLPASSGVSLLVSGRDGLEFVFAVAVPQADMVSERQLRFFRKDAQKEKSKRFRVSGDPMRAANDLIEKMVRGVRYDNRVSIAYTYFYVGQAVDYPRYMCRDCDEYDPYDSDLGYAATGTLEDRYNLRYPLQTAFAGSGNDYDVGYADDDYRPSVRTYDVVTVYPAWGYGYSYYPSWRYRYNCDYYGYYGSSFSLSFLFNYPYRGYYYPRYHYGYYGHGYYGGYYAGYHGYDNYYDYMYGLHTYTDIASRNLRMSGHSKTKTALNSRGNRGFVRTKTKTVATRGKSRSGNKAAYNRNKTTRSTVMNQNFYRAKREDTRKIGKRKRGFNRSKSIHSPRANANRFKGNSYKYRGTSRTKTTFKNRPNRIPKRTFTRQLRSGEVSKRFSRARVPSRSKSFGTRTKARPASRARSSSGRSSSRSKRR